MNVISVYEFCILTLSNFLKSFLVTFLGFSMYSFMSSTNNDNLTSFPIWTSFIFFFSYCQIYDMQLCGIIVVRISILVLFFILKEIISFFTIENNFCRFVICDLYHIEVNSHYAYFLEIFFVINGVEFCQKLFLHLLRWSFDFYSSTC